MCLASLSLLVLAFATAAGSAAQVDDVSATASPSPNAIMQAFSEAFTGIEGGLVTGDADAVAEHSRGLLVASGKSSALSPQRNVALSSRFDASLVAVSRWAIEIAALADADDLSGAAQATEALRSLCTSCHARFREDPSTAFGHPARGVVVMGQLKILDIDGEPRVDGSDVVVFLETDEALGPFAPPLSNPAISQAGRRFSPRVLPVVKGTTVDFPNDDLTFHNVFSLSRTRPFDLGIYAAGETRSVELPDTGLVRVYCNIHPDMLSSVLVLPNPYFAITDEQGGFVITGVPPGDYTLRVWNELGGEWEAPLSAHEPLVDIDGILIREDVVVIEHADKFGKPYREKY